MRPAIALEAPAQSALGKRSLSFGLREADYARYARLSLPALVFFRLAATREAESEGESDNGARLPYLAQETQVKRFLPFPKSLT